MDSRELDKYLGGLLKEYPFLLAILVTDMEGTEICKQVEYLRFQALQEKEKEQTEQLIEEIKIAHVTVFSSALDQLDKMEEGGLTELSTFYNGLYISQTPVGMKLALTILATENSNFTLIGLIAQDIKNNFKIVDTFISKVNKNYT